MHLATLMSTDLPRIASEHLMQLGSSTLRRLVQTEGPLSIPGRYGADPLIGLCQIVVAQQLSTQVAHRIWERILSHLPDRAARIAAFAGGDCEGLGVSQSKARTLQQIGILGDPWIENLMGRPRETRANQLLAITGIGPWTVAMWELFVQKDPDVWSDGDLILKRTITHFAADASCSTEAFLEAARPYRSYLALYCWRDRDASGR